MPDLPDVAAYIRALERPLIGQPLEHVRIASQFLLGTAAPACTSLPGAHEYEISALVASGKSNRAVAEELVISEWPAEKHLDSIFGKRGDRARRSPRDLDLELDQSERRPSNIAQIHG